MKTGITNTFTPLELESRTVLDTATAAYHCNRRPQTLRSWACFEDGPLRPLRINGRLAWRVDDIRRLLASDQPQTPGMSQQRHQEAGRVTQLNGQKEETHAL